MNRSIPFVIPAMLAFSLWFLGQPVVSANTLIDVNTATVQSLAEALPGIGPSKAEAIVAYREQHGGFATIESLTLVKGIGPGILKKIRTLILVTPPGQQSILQSKNTVDTEVAARNAVQSALDRANKDAARIRTKASK